MNFLVRGKYVITDPKMGKKSILYDSAAYIKENKIIEIDDYTLLKEKYPNAVIKGNGKQLLMPGLIDGHSHGAGLSPFQRGVHYDFLENFLMNSANGIVLKPQLKATMCAIRHLRNGCTTLHCIQGGNQLDAEYVEKIFQGYEKVGIRFAYSSGVRDLNSITYDDAAFYQTLPPELKQLVKPIIFNDKEAFIKAYFEHFEYLYNHYNSEDRKIIFGPLWVQGSADKFLQQIKTKADELGKISIHLHTLQTPIQKVFGLKKYGKSLLAHLDDLGLVDNNLVLGHAVFINQSDIDLLAAKHASNTHHASCNLVVRNGIAPVYFLHQAGVNVALGIDDKGINDDEDPFMEMRMIYYLHRIAGFDLTKTPPLSSFDILQMATINAARVCHFEGTIGALKPGMKADLLLVDLDRIMESPWVSPGINIADLLICRGKGTDVNTVMVNGNIILENHRFCHIDVDSIYEEVREQVKKGIDPKQKELAEIMQKLKPYSQSFYKRWPTPELVPFYKMNSRK